MSLPSFTGHRFSRTMGLIFCLCCLSSSRRFLQPLLPLTGARWRRGRRSSVGLRTSMPRSVKTSTAALIGSSATMGKQVCGFLYFLNNHGMVRDKKTNWQINVDLVSLSQWPCSAPEMGSLWWWCLEMPLCLTLIWIQSASWKITTHPVAL